MTTSRQHTLELVYIAIFAVLIAICSWISIPTAVPFTMQTFAIFLTLFLLGGKRGTLSVVVYLLLGAVGAPVFAGFSGGLGVLIGSTGGYLIGFLSTALLYWFVIKVPSSNGKKEIITLIIGLFLCYAFGTLWFVTIYTSSIGEVGILTALGWCVFPYILPDLLKLALAYKLSQRLSRHVNI